MIPINNNKRESLKKNHVSYNLNNLNNMNEIKHHIGNSNNNNNKKKVLINRFFRYKIRSKKYKRKIKNGISCETNLMESEEEHFKCYPKKNLLNKREYGRGPILSLSTLTKSTLTTTSSSPPLLSISSLNISSSNVETGSTSNLPVIFGVISAFLIILVILFFIIKRTISFKRTSLFGNNDADYDDDDDINRSISVKYNNNNSQEEIKLPTPAATISSSRHRRSYSSIPKFNYSSEISIRTSESSRYDFLNTKIDYLDQDFDNYFKPVHSLFEKDLIDEINETIKDDFEFPVEEVNWEECMR